MHIEHLHGAELIQRLAGREARCFESKPVLQGDLNAVGKESDEDVGFDAVFALIICHKLSKNRDCQVLF